MLCSPSSLPHHNRRCYHWERVRSVRAVLRGGSTRLWFTYRKNTKAHAEHVKGVLGDTLRAFANGRKDDWDVWLPYAAWDVW